MSTMCDSDAENHCCPEGRFLDFLLDIFGCMERKHGCPPDSCMGSAGVLDS